MKNEEELKEDAKKELEELRSSITEIGMASVMKEKLRSVYRLALDFDDAEHMLADWCGVADASDIPELKTMAKTIRTHIEGILAYWTSGGWTSAAVEGFNNKIRWLIKQAYGYRDREYFHLKIFDLPKTKIVKNL